MALYRCGGGTGAKVATGSMAWSTSSSTSVNCGFKPKYLVTVCYTSSNAAVCNIYDADYSTTQFAYHGNSSLGPKAFGTTINGALYSIDSNGFTINKTGTSGRTFYYFAIG